MCVACDMVLYRPCMHEWRNVIPLSNGLGWGGILKRLIVEWDILKPWNCGIGFDRGIAQVLALFLILAEWKVVDAGDGCEAKK
jgi:hypothetical protein